MGLRGVLSGVQRREYLGSYIGCHTELCISLFIHFVFRVYSYSYICVLGEIYDAMGTLTRCRMAVRQSQVWID